MDSISERQNFAKENITYSNNRIDLLLISISGGGIYVCLETIKYLSDNCRDPHWLIWVSGVAFLFTVIVNFIGQFVGKRVNELDYIMCQETIDAGDNPTAQQEADIKETDEKADKVEKWINPINYICTGLMITGLSSILFYFILIF
ncbi:MAG: hypothetical protein L3J11_00455 [Draconibacterium sp.]|nr:hypothetical protein [Draconibacterium sp.]